MSEIEITNKQPGDRVIHGDVRELSEERVRVFVVSRGVDISDRELEV